MSSTHSLQVFRELRKRKDTEKLESVILLFSLHSVSLCETHFNNRYTYLYVKLIQYNWKTAIESAKEDFKRV